MDNVIIGPTYAQSILALSIHSEPRLTKLVIAWVKHIYFDPIEKAHRISPRTYFSAPLSFIRQSIQIFASSVKS
ncbi:MAG: hypothetical protein ACI9Y1_003516, partial [Lentisphaeria bacterium]